MAETTPTTNGKKEYLMPGKTEEIPVNRLLNQIRGMTPDKAGEYLINIIKESKSYDWVEEFEKHFVTDFKPILVTNPSVFRRVENCLQTRAMDLYMEISGMFGNGKKGDNGKGNSGSIDDIFAAFDAKPDVSKPSASVADVQPDFIAPVDLGQYAANLNESSVFMSREDIKKRFDAAEKPKENVRYYRDSQIKDYLTQCSYELQSYRKKNEKTGAMVTERLLKMEPRLLYAFAAETADKKTDGEEFKKDLKYRTGIYYNIISCRNLLKNLLEPDKEGNTQVVGMVKEAGECLLEKIKAKGNSIADSYRKDRAEHPELFSNFKNNGGTK